jgi:hypothetical protein
MTRITSLSYDVLLNVVLTWISHLDFAICYQESNGYKGPIMVLKNDNCMKRSEGEVSFDIEVYITDL